MCAGTYASRSGRRFRMETVYGTGHAALLPVLTGYAQSLRSLGRAEEAAKIEQRAESIRQSGPQN